MCRLFVVKGLLIFLPGVGTVHNSISFRDLWALRDRKEAFLNALMQLIPHYRSPLTGSMPHLETEGNLHPAQAKDIQEKCCSNKRSRRMQNRIEEWKERGAKAPYVHVLRNTRSPPPGGPRERPTISDAQTFNASASIKLEQSCFISESSHQLSPAESRQNEIMEVTS